MQTIRANGKFVKETLIYKVLFCESVIPERDLRVCYDIVHGKLSFALLLYFEGNTLDLPMIVIGGGLARAWGLFAPTMFEAVHNFSVVYRLAEPKQRVHGEHDRTYIRPATIGPSAGLLGADMLPFLPHEMESNGIDPVLEERYV